MASHTSTPVGSAVYLSIVDDFTSTSQACVNPLFATPPSNETHRSEAPSRRFTETAMEPASVIPKPRKRRPRAATATGGTEHVSHETQKETNMQPATPVVSAVSATIEDCLACSGCVTTAETVLLSEQHSLEKLRQVLFNTTALSPRIVLTMSPAAWADWARHVHSHFTSTCLTHRQFQTQTTALFHTCLHVSAVLDGIIPLQWSLEAAAHEFCNAAQQHRTGSTRARARNRNPSDDASRIPLDEQYEHNLLPSVALSSTRTQYWLPPPPTARSVLVAPPSTGPRVQQALPLVTATCPAVTCLVEKSWHTAVPHLSTVVSPMTAAAHFWRTTYPPHTAHDTLFHVAVMPCHDKKLEASRKDFVTETKDGTGTDSTFPCVDVVVTTTELWHLVQDACRERNMDMGHVWSTRDSHATVHVCEVHGSLDGRPPGSDDVAGVNGSNSSAAPILYVPSVASNHSPGASPSGVDDSFFAVGSGGYADFVFRYASYHLFGVSVTASSVWRPVTSLPLDGTHTAQRSSARMRQRRREFYEAFLCRSRTTGLYSVATTGDDDATQETVLRFAAVYGMQTVQTALNRHVKDGYYDYIEAMACPGSCLNGGGQLRLDADRRETPVETRERIRATQHYVWHTTPPMAAKSHGDAITSTGTTTASESMDSWLYTRYHVVPPMQHSFGAAAGVAVEDTVW